MMMNSFSGSILIARRGRVLLSKGYGMANIEHRVANTPQTRFRLGSITKPFTAIAILQLQERGLLSVNDPIRKHLPDYPKVGDTITIHHLLTHTSGILSYTSLPDYRETMAIPSPPRKSIDKVKHLPLEFPPGARFKYNNSGYILLGLIIETVSGKSYEQYVAENVLRPAKMKNSGYDHNYTILRHRASGYERLRTGFLANARYIDMTTPHAAGALYSTVGDLYLFERALRGEALLKKRSLEKAFTPFKENYGYGWFIVRALRRKCIGHQGSINGFASFLMRFPDDDVCIIVLSNYYHAPAMQIAGGLAEVVFGEKHRRTPRRVAVKVDPALYDAYVGQYALPPNYTVTITKEKSRLFTRLTGQPKYELFAQSETRFFLKEVDAEVTFFKNAAGAVTHLVIRQYGMDMRADKIK